MYIYIAFAVNQSAINSFTLMYASALALAVFGMLVGVFLCNAGVAASFCTISLEADAREVRSRIKGNNHSRNHWSIFVSLYVINNCAVVISG